MDQGARGSGSRGKRGTGETEQGTCAQKGKVRTARYQCKPGFGSGSTPSQALDSSKTRFRPVRCRKISFGSLRNETIGRSRGSLTIYRTELKFYTNMPLILRQLFSRQSYDAEHGYLHRSSPKQLPDKSNMISFKSVRIQLLKRHTPNCLGIRARRASCRAHALRASVWKVHGEATHRYVALEQDTTRSWPDPSPANDHSASGPPVPPPSAAGIGWWEELAPEETPWPASSNRMVRL